jgi:glycosyltransferase involved in cell wall biosynthesis
VLSPKKRRERERVDIQDRNLAVLFQAIGRIPGIPGSHQAVEVIRLWMRLRKLSFQPDVVWVHSPATFLAYALSKFRRRPCIATVHGVYGSFYAQESRLQMSPQLAQLFYLQNNLLQKLEFRHAPLLTAYSKYLRSLVLEKQRRARVVVIPNGVDTDRFRPIAATREKSILYVGRMAAIKGVHVLISSMEQIAKDSPDWTMVLAGGAMDQPLSFFQRFMTKESQARIKFIGPVPNDRLPRLFAQSGIFVMPTLRDGFEIAMMEAMATGIPCVTTGAFERTQLYGSYAELVPPGDPDSLGRTLIHMIHHYPEYTSHKSQHKRISRAREFDWTHVARMFEQLFRKLAT